MYLFAFMCLETDNGSGMVRSLFGNVFLQIAIGYCGFIRKRFVEFNNKIVFEVLGNSAAIAGGIADYFMIFRNHLDIRSFVESIYNNV